MNRRNFLKRLGALAVSGAFPLPATEPLTFCGIPLIFDEGPAFTAYAGIDRSFNPWWKAPARPEVVLVGDAFMNEMRRQWRALERRPE